MNSPGVVRHLELFVPLRISASPSRWELCAETKSRAQGEFLRGGTDGSNPSPSSEESANFRFLSKRRASEICRDTAHRYGLQPRSTLGAVAGSGHLCFAGLHRGSIITLAEQSRSSRFPRTGERPNHA